VITELHGSSLGAYDSKTPDGFWALWRQYGGWWSEKGIPREPELTDFVKHPLPIVQAVFDGDASSFPFYLYPYPSISLSDGRGANQPWLQETPDPMTTVSWRTWVEINPQTAQTLGVTDDDIVRISSPYGTMEAPVVVYRGIRPDVIAIPIGQRQGDFGRFADGRGFNPLALVSPLSDADSGSLAWGATRVRVERTGRTQTLARLESLDGAGRESLR
jgi:anaerobic selenocysteine-containing dehydrogenase